MVPSVNLRYLLRLNLFFRAPEHQGDAQMSIFKLHNFAVPNWSHKILLVFKKMQKIVRLKYVSHFYLKSGQNKVLQIFLKQYYILRLKES